MARARFVSVYSSIIDGKPMLVESSWSPGWPKNTICCTMYDWIIDKVLSLLPPRLINKERTDSQANYMYQSSFRIAQIVPTASAPSSFLVLVDYLSTIPTLIKKQHLSTPNGSFVHRSCISEASFVGYSPNFFSIQSTVLTIWKV